MTTPASPDVWGAYLVSVTKEFEGYDYEARKHQKCGCAMTCYVVIELFEMNEDNIDDVNEGLNEFDDNKVLG